MSRFLGVVLLLGLGATQAAAQEGCLFGNRGNDRVVDQNLPGVGRVTYITRPHLVCDGGIQIFADSAVAYGDRGFSHLIGRVRYLESSRELLADEARYFSNEGRLQAEGNVTVRDDEQGSSIRNGDLVYLLANDFREEGSMTVTTGADGLRPVATLAPPRRETGPVPAEVPEPDSVPPAADSLPLTPDSLPATPDSTVIPSDSVAAPDPPESPAPDSVPATPYTVVGDRMYLAGGGNFTAAGAVEITRDSLHAWADSASYDQTGGALLLDGQARVEGEAYTLLGRRISMSSPGEASSEVQALREARLLGDGFALDAARILVFLQDDALERLVATPLRPAEGEEPDSLDLVRPEALVREFTLTADSLEIRAPGESIERVFAAGTARSESSARDSLNVEALPDVARRDWLEGDTVVITFRPALPGAPASQVEVDTIVARVDARSLYRLPSTDTTAVAGTDPPAVHYVTGREIRIEMADGEVSSMRVVGQTRGVHFEPLVRRTVADTTAADSLAGAPPDTSGVPPDTGSVANPAAPERMRDEAARPGERTRLPREEHGHPWFEETPWTRP